LNSSLNCNENRDLSTSNAFDAFSFLVQNRRPQIESIKGMIAAETANLPQETTDPPPQLAGR